MMISKQPYLEKYTGRKSRHECPACHDKHSFTYYLDGNTGEPIHPTVGRCNHEASCEYHYTPKEYRRDNVSLSGSFAPAISKQKRAELPKQPGRIPKAYLIQALGYGSNFIEFLRSIFDRYTLESPTIERIMGDYYLGCTPDKKVIFWQLDVHNRIRTGKVMQYDPKTGKRVKNANGAIDWVHARLKRSKELPEDFNLVQCLFGEHLLKRYPNKVVALVESEKSAIIGAGAYPQYIWLATGGRSQLSSDKLRVLRGRTVIMFPDADGYALWCERSAEINSMGCKAIVSDVLEKNATQAEKDAKIDIADWLIRQLRETKRIPAVNNLTREERILHSLGIKNPAVYALIASLGLVSASTGEKLQTIKEGDIAKNLGSQI